MIGIVIVSHSQKLAEGVLELASQMTQGRVVMEAVGGIDDPENPIGTDPMQVMSAIEAVAGQAAEGVLVIMDLGSALMSAETALEFLPDEVRKKVLLCSAPIVEGTVAAAVQASIGGSLQAASAEAGNALQVKIQQLAPVTGEAIRSQDHELEQRPAGGDVLELELVINNKLGLHARPAANLVATAGTYTSTIQVCKGGEVASAKSINQVALLSIKQGDTITLMASGADAEAALAALKTLHEDHFGESDDVCLSSVTVTKVGEERTGDNVVAGLAGAGGYAFGEVFLFETTLPEVECKNVNDVDQEVVKLEHALEIAIADIKELERQAEKNAGKSSSEIFKAHALILEDRDLYDKAAVIIRTGHLSSEYAWHSVISDTAEAYRNLDSEYMQARAADVIDCGTRVVHLLIGAAKTGLKLKQPAVVVAYDLAPSDVAGLDPELVLGIVTEVGTVTSHAVIICRSLGIPTVMGIPFALASKAKLIGLDGYTGTVWLDPASPLNEEINANRIAWLDAREQAKMKAKQPAVTKDGRKVPVMCNVGVPADAAQGLEFGAQGVGLFRTEFLFQDREQAPGEEEQTAAYIEAAKNMRGLPVIIRTLDIGGDKPVAYLSIKEEKNPFLGERGVRFCMARPQLFRTQLRALLRAAAEENIWIMYPMISSVEEFKAVLALQEEVKEELCNEGVTAAKQVKTGIMIEVPSAVAVADKLANIVDFFSIGTNDLTQYVMAADRGNIAVAKLCDSLDPAVLRMIKQTCDTAHKNGIEVGLCGELAANSLAVPLLLGLGLDELSMSGPAIPEVKQVIGKVTLAECTTLATLALAAESATEVRNILGSS